MSHRIGFHVSISGGISNSVDNALKIGCNAFQIFSRNPRGWNAKSLQGDDVEKFTRKLSDNKIDRDSIFVHMPYLPNLSSPDPDLHKRSTESLLDEITRCNTLGIPHIILHLGRHGEKGKEDGVNQLLKACNFAINNYLKSPAPALASDVEDRDKTTKDHKHVMLILENNAGGENSVGTEFEELGLILDKLKSSSSRPITFGICLDTCHAFAAGYDLRTKEDVNETLDKFNSKIGLKNLKVIHLNDSKDKLNSNCDRHEHIGLGEIGKEGLRELLIHDAVRKLPFILETPIDTRRDDHDNLRVILSFLGNGI